MPVEWDAMSQERQASFGPNAWLVDEMYDRQVNLVCTAAAPPHALYRGERLRGAFERCASRLVEMQSAGYLAGGHRG